MISRKVHMSRDFQPIVIIDGMNFAHRARSGFTTGEFTVVYNLLRQLRAQVELHAPSRVIIALEGHPKKRHQLLAGYKANRVIDASTEVGARAALRKQDFFRQATVAFDLLRRHFPVSLMRHPDHEADDLVHNVIKNAATSSEFTVVSTDSDFIQLLQRFSNVRLYNPVTKSFVESPPHDYVFWKALRGDHTDNVPSLPGIDDDEAGRLMEDPDALRVVLNAYAPEFCRNVDLIRFIDFDESEMLQVDSSCPTCDWDAVKVSLETMEFKSILKEPYWSRFRTTFDTLW